VRRGDFTDASSLRHSFEGADQVLIISSNAAAYGGDPLAQHERAIAAAKASGARRIVYTSQMAASLTSHFPPAVHHGQTEAMLQASGVAWTSLRNGFYASAALRYIGRALGDGVLRTPASGKFAWTTHADLAAAAAAVLVDEGRFEGPTPPLTGREAIDFAELCTIASAASGRPIRHEALTDEQFEAALLASGTPPFVVPISTGMFRAGRAGEFASIDPTLERLIGYPPRSIGDVVADHFRS
jgi:uncharacterized protein YbjT (DUF2867 family)